MGDLPLDLLDKGYGGVSVSGVDSRHVTYGIKQEGKDLLSGDDIKGCLCGQSSCVGGLRWASQCGNV